MNTKLGPVLTKTNVINFMTEIGLRLGTLMNTAPASWVTPCGRFTSRICASSTRFIQVIGDLCDKIFHFFKNGFNDLYIIYWGGFDKMT